MRETTLGPPRRVRAGVLDVAFHQVGHAAGAPVVLLHGFPYDVHAYAEVAPCLAHAGCRVIVPYMRGFGPTTFVDDTTMRSGQQGALGADLQALLNALQIERAVLAGYDWGGRAACVVAALWPERCAGLVSLGSYNIQQLARAAEPVEPMEERRLWYQYYFLTERGRTALARDRQALCRFLWQSWSPGWTFEEAVFQRSAAALENPDFVDVVIHSYRHRHGRVEGDPAYDHIERRLAAQPPIKVRSITLDGAADGVAASLGTERHAHHFIGPRMHRVVASAGHNLPQEQPAAFADAVLELLVPHAHGEEP